MAWNCESWLILAVWGMVVASWNHHGTNISPCSDSLINNNFYPAPVRTFVNLDKTDITRGIELNDHWRILMNFTVFSYLFVAHGRVVNFPSFPLIHAGISDLKVTYRHIITISCTKQWHGKYLVLGWWHCLRSGHVPHVAHCWNHVSLHLGTVGTTGQGSRVGSSLAETWYLLPIDLLILTMKLLNIELLKMLGQMLKLQSPI